MHKQWRGGEGFEGMQEVKCPNRNRLKGINGCTNNGEEGKGLRECRRVKCPNRNRLKGINGCTNNGEEGKGLRECRRSSVQTETG